MWPRLLALPLLAALVACGGSRKQETAATPRVAEDTETAEIPRVAKDTVVTTRTVVDTTIITMDTTIAVDTTFRVDTTRTEAGRGEIVDTTR